LHSKRSIEIYSPRVWTAVATCLSASYFYSKKRIKKSCCEATPQARDSFFLVALQLN